MRKVHVLDMYVNDMISNLREVREVSGELITYAKKRNMRDYVDECLNGENECAVLLAKYTRYRDGKDVILWFDNETLETFVSY